LKDKVDLSKYLIPEYKNEPQTLDFDTITDNNLINNDNIENSNIIGNQNRKKSKEWGKSVVEAQLIKKFQDCISLSNNKQEQILQINDNLINPSSSNDITIDIENVTDELNVFNTNIKCNE